MTVAELLFRLKQQPADMAKFVERPEVPLDATVRHFYLVRQAAERLTRKRVFFWHNYPIVESYKVQCQLEYDRIFSDSIDYDRFNHQRLRKFFERTFFSLIMFLFVLFEFDRFSFVAQ